MQDISNNYRNVESKISNIEDDIRYVKKAIHIMKSHGQWDTISIDLVLYSLQNEKESLEQALIRIRKSCKHGNTQESYHGIYCLDCGSYI